MKNEGVTAKDLNQPIKQQDILKMAEYIKKIAKSNGRWGGGGSNRITKEMTNIHE